MRFQFDHSVSAFAAGHYSLTTEGPPLPALVYATFHNKLYVYYNVTLPRITLSTLTERLEAHPVFQQEEYEKYLHQPSQLRQLVASLLYGA